MTFGYGTKEFEVTAERLGCYRPEEHIDNPKDYADNVDARQYDRRLRGPVNERKELVIDPVVGLKAYIASENLGIDTSAGLVRKLFGRSIQLGRRYARSQNKDDLYEALRLLGTGCHCLEDYSAHSNYTELALIELGERDVFPHVGRACQIHIQGARHPVYPIVTGTFGGVDFLHSVTGEFDDKVTQSEIQELEGTLRNAQNQGENTSLIQDLLSKLPDGIFGGKDEAGKAHELQTNAAQQQMASTRISPRKPEEWLQYVRNVQTQVYPILEWHDDIMKSIMETVEKVPILPDLIEQIQDQINMFVFSLLAPFVLPVIGQVKTELNTGSSTIIQSSLEKQHVVFSDDHCSDPTHSMLSKDHFSNVLNEPAGKIAGQVLRWAVPQLIACWDDERIDVDRTLNRIIRGVFHHPALRDYGDDGAADGRRLMFQVVQNWWQMKDDQEKDVLRDQLSREGVEEGRNHKPGVVDHGHGSGTLAMNKSMMTSGGPGGAGMGDFQRIAGEAVGGGVLGDLVGGVAGAVGASMLSSGFDNDENSQTYQRTSYGDDGSRTQTVTQMGGRGGNYQQAQYTRTDDQYGGHTEQYATYTQHREGGERYSGQTHYEEQSSYGDFDSETRRYESADIGPRIGGREGASSYGGGFGGQVTYGRNDEDQDERPRHGHRHHQDEFGQPGPHHGPRGNHSQFGQPEFGGGFDGRQQRDDFGGNDDYGHRQETSGWGEGRSEAFARPGRNEYDSGDYDQQDQDRIGGGYPGRQQRSEDDGRLGGRDQQSEYGRGYERRQERPEFGSGYGGREHFEYSEGHGSRRHDVDEVDMPGGFGGEEGDGEQAYGGRRHHQRRDEDDEQERDDDYDRRERSGRDW